MKKATVPGDAPETAKRAESEAIRSPSPAEGAGEVLSALRAPEAILDHPLFPELRSWHLGRNLQVYGPKMFPGWMPSDVRRTVLIGLVTRSLGEPRDSGPILTPTRLKEQLEAFGVYGARQVDAYLARLVATGFIEVAPLAEDRRVRAIRPLEPLAEWHWAMLELYFRPLQAMFPGPAFDLILTRDSGFLSVFGRVATDETALTTVPVVLGRDPDYTAFLSRGSGGLLANALMKHVADTGETEIQETNILALGSTIGRSRSHVRNLLAAAAEAGFVERAGSRAQALRVLPRLIDTSKRFLADSLRCYEYTFRRAERAYRGG